MNILITGGASGLGEAITKKLAASTDTVYFTYKSSKEKAMALEVAYANVNAIRCDFTSIDDVNQLCESIARLNIQVLINNAMTGFQQNYFHKLDPLYFADSFQKNVMPVISVTQAAIRHFRKAKSGKIITVLSAAILNTPPIGWSEYVAAKAYLLALSKAWASENAAFNITSNCVSPAFMQTSLTSDMDDRLVADMIAKHPLKALLTVEETAESIDFLVKAGRHINGINLILNAANNVV
jgi:NAD(P)-dependent dehydrogenase (short-subunit alcohol dehydrogenase family)